MADKNPGKSTIFMKIGT